MYPIDAGGHAPLDAEGREIPLISLSAIDTGFDDAEENPTGCFPNQLYGAAAQNNRLYVTSVCASPAGPVEGGRSGFADLSNNNFKTLVHPVVFTIDTANNMEVGEPVVLSKQLADANGVNAPDQRLPLIPNEVVLAPEGGASGALAYVSSFGAAAVFSIQYDEAGKGLVGMGEQHYIKLFDSSLPIGMAILSGKRALALDDVGRKLGANRLGDQHCCELDGHDTTGLGQRLGHASVGASC